MVERVRQPGEMSEGFEHLVAPSAAGIEFDSRDRVAQVGARRRAAGHAEDFVDGRGADLLVASDQLFVELFARPQADEFDRNLCFRHEPR